MCSQSYRSAGSINVVLAVCPGIGVVSYWAYRGSMNEAMFLIFLESMVIPSLVGFGPRVFMWDNLSSHLTAGIRSVVQRSGHRSLNRPVHSPDFAPIEWCFGEMDAYLRVREGMHTLENYDASIGEAAANVRHANIRQYFARAHYHMPELSFRLYDDSQ